MSYEGRDLEALANLQRYQRWVVEMMEPWLGDEIVELGAGTGNISQHLVRRAARVELVEPSENLIPMLRDRVAGGSEVCIRNEHAETWTASTAAGAFDTAVMVNVLEHIEDDLGVLKELRRIVRPGGHLLVYVPALAWLFSEMDTRLGHFRRYSRGGLLELVEAAGWTVQRLSYADALGVLPWLVVNRMLGSTRFEPRMMEVYDRLFVPPGRLLEAWLPVPLGKNLILAARAE